MLDATERATHAPCAVEKSIGLPRSASPTLVAYWNVSVAVLGRHGGTVYGSEAYAPTFGARTQSLVVACRAAESLRAAMAWVANRVAAISAADTKVILVICLSIWWQKSGKRSTSCYEERPALGNISSRPFNEARASVVTSGDSGGHVCGRIRRARNHKSRSGRRSKRHLRRSPHRLPSTRRANSNGMF
jgi:hypothetical protein